MNFIIRYFCTLFCVIFVTTHALDECGPHKFSCRNGKCIAVNQICDGTVDCADDSDETHALCHKIKCLGSSYRCAYGACIDIANKCNGINECVDKSDERIEDCHRKVYSPSPCGQDKFMCESGECINLSSKCDGVPDCEDNSDETLFICAQMMCPEFKCAYGACIDHVYTCNGKGDCIDRSDENSELCQMKATPVVEIADPSPSQGSCSLPKQPSGGSYDISNCKSNINCYSIPSETLVPSHTLLKYACNKGFILIGKTEYLLCLNGTWNVDPPKCEKYCEPLFSNSMDIECVYKGYKVDCTDKQKISTRVKQKCKPLYHIPQRLAFEPLYDLTCMEDGKWDQQLGSCDPDCGIQTDNLIPLINNGHNTTRGEFPWHVGLYCENCVAAQGTEMQYICGGSIISSRAIISAAHCVVTSTGIRSANSLQVAAGKYQRMWNIKDNGEQRLSVKRIFVSDYYVGRLQGYIHDIAILEVQNEINFNIYVLPVCIDWNSFFKTDPRIYGIVPGWGLNENLELTDHLKKINMSIVDQKTCISMSSDGFKQFVTIDKFCAIFNNGSGVQNGDSGGGLTVKANDQYFLKGIVSVKRKDVNDFAAFTNVSVHLEWIKLNLQKIQKSYIIL